MSLVAIRQLRGVDVPIFNKNLRLITPNLESEYGLCWYIHVDVFDDGIMMGDFADVDLLCVDFEVVVVVGWFFGVK